MSTKHGRNRSAGQSRQGARSTVKRILHLGRSQTALPVADQAGEPSNEEVQTLTVEIVAQKYSAGEITYDSAKLILTGGSKVTGAFPPLQTAIVGLLSFVERMDSTTDVDEDLARLIARIDQISIVFRSVRFGYLCSTDELQRWAADLAQRINTYRETIISKRQRTVFVRFLTIEDDQRHATKTRRDLDGVVQDFMMNTTGSIASNMDKLVRENSYGRLRTASGAGYEAQDVQGCVGGTRDDLLNEVDVWAKELDGPPLLWLTGDPFVGKTCIAYALCQRLDDQHLLGGSFFCSREKEERRDYSLVVPTLAHSLACSATRLATQMQEIHQNTTEDSRESNSDDDGLHTLTHARFRYASGLAGAVQGNLDATHFVPKHQFQTFLSRPASAAFIEPSLPACIFLIDAIDEIKAAEAAADQLMDSIARYAKPARLKFVITSRYDEHMHDTILAPGKRSNILRLLHVEELAVIAETRAKLLQLSGDNLPQKNWPLVEEVGLLARQVYGQPMFGSIALRYLAQYPEDLPNKLRSVVSTIRTPSNPASLDGLFDLILKDSLTRILNDRRPSLAFRCVLPTPANTRLSLSDWSHLTGHLKSVSSGEQLAAEACAEGSTNADSDRGDDEHLVEYLNDSPSAVCQAWRCRKETIHLYLLRCCSTVMDGNLRFNICGASTSYLSNEQQKLRDNIPGHVAYACSAWIEHAVLAAPHEDVFNWAIEVLRKRWLFWLEATSVIEGVDAVSSLLQKLHCFCLQHTTYGTPNAPVGTLAELTKHARQFVFSTRDVIRVSAPHIYLSALGANPLSSGLICDLQLDYARTVVIRSESNLAMVPFMEMQEHTGGVLSVAFSPDGQRLASASGDGTIRLWDARTGASIGQPLQGHTDWVLSVAFSPDGQRLASASSDNTIRLWDARTGAQIGQPLQGHTSGVWSVAFSPDGQRLASASSDNTIRLWDARTGAPIGQPLQGHNDWVRSVAISPDGQRLASASDDGRIRLRDARTGAPIGRPLQGHTGYVLSVAFSPDG